MPIETREQWLTRFESARDMFMDADYLNALATRVDAGAGGTLLMLAGHDALVGARRVGVYAGSFNPQTIAHAALARSASAAFGLDTLVWAFSRVTVDKERVERAMLTDRVAQVEAYRQAVAPADAIAVLDAGLYADQAAMMRRAISQDGTLWLIVGFDKVAQIFDPRYYDHRDAALHRLFDAADLLVAPRGDDGEAALESLLARPENQQFARHISPIPFPESARTVSSTTARQTMSEHQLDDPYAALAALVTPEGAALGLATGAYRDRASNKSERAIDRYAIRGAWLKVLAGWHGAGDPGLRLDTLVRLTTRDNARGESLRHWLEGEEQDRSYQTLKELVGRE